MFYWQPIPQKLKHYNDLTDGNEGLRQEDRDQWQQISNTLQKVLRAAAAEAKERDLISAEREHTYHMSGKACKTGLLRYFAYENHIGIGNDCPCIQLYRWGPYQWVTKYIVHSDINQSYMPQSQSENQTPKGWNQKFREKFYLKSI